MTSQPATPQPYVLQAGQGVPGFGSDVKAGRIATGGSMTVIESRTTGGAPLHVHTREDEYFYVLAGQIIVWCGDETFEVGPGGFVFLPRGVPHAWDVQGEEATLLLITVPAMLEEFLAEYHAAFSGGPELRAQVAAQYGITFLDS